MKNRIPSTVERSANEQGFAIPIAMGMGLIMILLATTAILRSQNQGIAAINKSAKDRSRSVAELGVAKIQAFLNKYRAAANLSSAQWVSATNANFPSANAVCIAPATLTGTGSAIAEVNSMGGNGWRDVVDGDGLTIGQFKLVSYSGNDGGLTVEGRSKVGTPAESLTQINVTIPVFSSNLDQVPGLWAKTSVDGNPTVKSDVMGPCAGTMSASPTSAGAGSNPAILRTRLSMPDAPAQPTSSTTPNSTTGSVVETSGGVITKAFHNFTAPTVPITFASLTNRELPRYKVSETIGGVAKEVPVDQPDADGVYKYIVSSLDSSFQISTRDNLAKRIANSKKPTGQLATNDEVNVEKAALQSVQVSIWVAGNIDLQNKVIVNPCGATGSSTSCDPFDVKVYGTATGSPTLTLNQTGTAVCDVFFHLPNYAATVNSGGTANTQDCGGSSKNTGIYWINTWSSATGTTLDPNRGRWVDAPTQFIPRIGPLSGLGS